MGDGDATQAVGNQDHRRALGGNRLLQRVHPVLPLRGEPVVLLDPGTVGQGALPVTLPMVVWRSLPARHNQVTNRLIAHGDASSEFACLETSIGRELYQ
ncbi:hypothetical protein D3C85_1536890 [compost metagenome]